MDPLVVKVNEAIGRQSHIRDNEVSTECAMD